MQNAEQRAKRRKVAMVALALLSFVLIILASAPYSLWWPCMTLFIYAMGLPLVICSTFLKSGQAATQKSASPLAAFGNFLAALWEDVFDKVFEEIELAMGIESDGSASFNIINSAVHLVLMLLLTTWLRFFCTKLDGVRLRAFLTTTIAILAGWSTKSLLAKVSKALQEALAGETSYCASWLPPTCFVVVLAIAIVVTFFAALTAFLPNKAPPKKLSDSLPPPTVPIRYVGMLVCCWPVRSTPALRAAASFDWDWGFRIVAASRCPEAPVARKASGVARGLKSTR